MVVANSSQETKKLAASLLKKLGSKNLICLYGPLGAGKTTFVKGLAKALGIKKTIVSPTFVLLRNYCINHPASSAGRQSPITNHQSLTHLDCYRLSSAKDLKSIDLKELWSNRKNLVVIEWADKIKPILPKKRIDVKFEYASKHSRKINING